MNTYEIMLILLPDLGETNLKKTLEEIRKAIKDSGGEITNEEEWGLKELSYRIKRHDRGFYVIFNLAMDANKITEFESLLNINQEVIRYLITRVPEAYKIRSEKEYKEEAEAIKDDRKPKKDDKKEKKTSPKKAKIEKTAVEKKEEPKEDPKKESKEEPKEEPKEEEPRKEPEKQEEPKEKLSTLDDVDEKLKSIIDDPDITL